jgi:hypothetical protein
MTAGETMDLAATITPTNATEDVFWISLDQSVISVDRYGVQTKLTALRAGTTTIFATNRTETVLSEKITVIVNSKDFAGDVLGSYLGSGTMKGLNAFVPDEGLSGVTIRFERITSPPEYTFERVKMTISVVTALWGNMTITGEDVIVSSAYELSRGDSRIRLMPMNVTFDEFTGSVVPTSKALTIKLLMNNQVEINLTAQKQD